MPRIISLPILVNDDNTNYNPSNQQYKDVFCDVGGGIVQQKMLLPVFVKWNGASWDVQNNLGVGYTHATKVYSPCDETFFITQSKTNDIIESIYQCCGCCDNIGSNVIPITGADFFDSTNYNNPNIVGSQFIVYANIVNRYLIPTTEYVITPTGFNVIMPDFNAILDPAQILVIIKY